MAKFALECPECKCVNTASNFILAKKVIACDYCRKEIDIRKYRLIAKTCPDCNKFFVYDLGKTKGQKCPSCGREIHASDTKKADRINCPQCACAIEVDQTKDTYRCPICDYELDVKKELAKAKLVSDTGVSVIQYEGDNSTFVWKHPIEDFNLGSQLVVHESQEAVFFLNGEALDTFGPGRHTLETENIPILKKIYAIPTGSQTPFHAEVYFVNKATLMGLKWGTDSRVRFIDPMTGIPLDIGASGEMNLQVSDSRKLLIKLVGTTGGLTTENILSKTLETTQRTVKTTQTIAKTTNDNLADEYIFSASHEDSARLQAALKGYFRAPLMTEIKSYLAAVIKEQHINILEIDAHMGALSEALREKISPKFEEYGLTIPKFYITNIALPENDKNFKDIKALISQAYIGVKTEEVQTSIAEAARQRKIVEEQTKAQLDMIRAQTEAEMAKTKSMAEAEALKAKGMAEAEVMQAKGYSEKDVLAADVQKAYAEGLGKMSGGGSSGGGGGVATDLIGMMAGMKMAGAVFDKMDGILSPSAENTSQEANPAPKAPETWTCSCGENANTKKFCMSCGRPKPELKKADSWDCVSCGTKGITSKFCPECGAKRPEPPAAWACPECGCKDITSKFCPECGSRKPE